MSNNKKWRYELKDKKVYGTMIKEEIKVTLQNNKSEISYKDVEKIVLAMEKGFEKEDINAKILVRGMSDRYRTLKGYKTKLNQADIEDYYEGLVEDTSKFLLFSQLQIIVVKERPVKNLFLK